MMCGLRREGRGVSFRGFGEKTREKQTTYQDLDVEGRIILNGYMVFINCSWVVTRWQYIFTHKQYTEQHK
jgi:hypothetical protein